MIAPRQSLNLRQRFGRTQSWELLDRFALLAFSICYGNVAKTSVKEL